MSGFAKLIPAFTVKVPISPPSVVGSAKAGGLNQVIALVDHPGGGIKSEPGYPIQVDAKFIHGSDLLRTDPDGDHLRLNAASILQQRNDPNAFFSYSYSGVIDLGGAAAKVLAGDPNAKSTDFGDIFSQVHFESGNPALQPLEHKIFVGSGHFLLEPGKPIVVEYKISEVTL